MANSKKPIRKTKSATVNRMLRRANGATLAEMEKATSWQPHSCRAFLSGVRKQGAVVAKQERSSGELAYKITTEAEQ